MSKKGGNQTVTTQPDEQTRQYLQQLYGASTAAAGTNGAGPNPMSKSAADYYANTQAAGNLGFGALRGDPAAVAAMMNPFQNQVIDRVKSQFGDLSRQASRGTADAATRAGAFGGSRHGVVEGTRLAEVEKGAQDKIAGLMSDDYAAAMSRAGGLASMGMQGAGQQHQMGEYFRMLEEMNNPDVRRAEMLRRNYVPTGGGSTSQPTNRNAGAGFLGGAVSGGTIGANFGPWGAGIGAGVGGLIGLL